MPVYEIEVGGKVYEVESAQPPDMAMVERLIAQPSAPERPTGFTSVDALTAEGGPLDSPIYRNLIGSARYGAMGSPMVTAPVEKMRQAAGAVKGFAGRVAGVAVPAAKKELQEHGLEAVGVPGVIARPVKAVVKDLRGTSPVSGAPIASPRGAPAPQAAPVASGSAPRSQSAPSMSPQRLRNEVGLAARRANTKLTEQEYAVAEGMVQQGASPAEAVRTVAQVAKPAPAPAIPKPKLSAAETREYVRLRGTGKTNDEAMQALADQRALVAKLGTPSPETVRQAVAERNATGRWSK